jgi:poly-beta-1,6-N-acetyl-D-glucosamine synthase
MKGWKTRTFTDKICIHHRTMGTAQRGALKATFKQGAKDYSLGNHPLWELFRTLYQTKNSPVVIGGLALGAGYFWSMARGTKIPVSSDVVAFTHREQMQRLKRFLGGKQSRSEGVIAARTRS